MAARTVKVGASKVVTFYKNGDKFFRGYKLAITPQKYRNMDTLLNDLTRLLNLPLGARYILTKTGKVVEDLQEFEHGQGYICSSFPKLKNLRYGVVENLPYWNSSKHVSKDKAVLSTKYFETFKSVSDGTSNWKRPDNFKPKIITVIRYGYHPRRSAKVLLNKRTAQTLDQVLNEVTAAIGVWGTNGVRRLYDLNGKRIKNVSDLFNQDDYFIAVGNEKLHMSDINDIIHNSNLKPTKTRLPSLNSTEESDVSTSDQHTLSHKVKLRNSVKLPSIRRNENNGSLSPENVDIQAENQNADTQGNEKSKARTENRTKNSKNSKVREDDCEYDTDNNQKTIAAQSENSVKGKSEFASHEEDKDVKQNVENVEDIYTLGEKIGDGNFAVVRIGIDKKTEVKYALKIVERKKIIGKEDMLKDEIRIMRLCNHENIVKLYGTHHTLFNVYLVMELITGGDLFDEISNSVKFDESVAASFTKDISQALHYLHIQNIVHRDLKPENLLVNITSSGKKHLKLADFGLAVEIHVPLFTVCGTPTYVAPEILEEAGYGLKVDIWAAGVILYIMLCGFPPFRSPNKDQDELFDLIIAGDFEFLSPYWDDVSQDARDLVGKLLTVDSRQRFTAQQILTHQWIQAADKSFNDEDRDKASRRPEFNARRKFKGAAIAVTSSNRLQNIGQFQFKRGEKLLGQCS